MNSKTFIAEKTHSALFLAGKKAIDSLTAVAVLDFSLLVILTGNFDKKIPLPIIKLDVDKDISILLIALLAIFYSYRYITFILYENLLEKMIGRILADSAYEKKPWSIFYPSFHTFSTITKRSGFFSILKYIVFYIPVSLILYNCPFMILFIYKFKIEPAIYIYLSKTIGTLLFVGMYIQIFSYKSIIKKDPKFTKLEEISEINIYSYFRNLFKKPNKANSTDAKKRATD